MIVRALAVTAVVAVAACTSIAVGPNRTTSPSGVHSSTTSIRSTTPSAADSTVVSISVSSRAAGVRASHRFTVSFAGDVHFMEVVGARLRRNPATVFGPAAAVLRKADLTMVNLETAITTRGTPQDKAFTFRAPPVALTALRDAGIDVATMANNHGADYGATGLSDSLHAIRKSHFPVIGIGANIHAAFAPYKRTLHGVRVAIFAADQVQDETTLRLFSAGAHAAGVANAYDPRLITAVRAAHRAGYVVIVYLHWGIEYQTCPSGDQTSLASRLATAGASAVIGTHAHVLQGAGWLPNGTFVAYGLGNYLWWRTFGNDQDDNGVLTLTFAGSRVVADRFAPAHLATSGVPVPAKGADARRILAEWNADRQCTTLSATAPH